MRRLFVIFALIFLFSNTSICAAGVSEYILDAGDVLNITVWGQEELKVEKISVRPDGKIAFPLVGEVQAAGVTPAVLAANLTVGLSEYVKNSQVTVNIFKYHTTRVYVLGEVTKPGMYEIERQHNLLDAIGAAGSPTRDAAKKKVYIIRKDSMDKPIRANLLNLLEKGDMTQNYVLNDGDVVYLTNNGRIDFARDILPWLSAAYQVNEINK